MGLRTLYEVKETSRGCGLNGTTYANCNDDGVVFPILDEIVGVGV